ncbi:DinB family protein [Fulvivirgaceae bacterium BMA10]|uniref:DinB family protein n=1 Tax=Splendidivirga corallicola TaxID=3051826 RepID=A0ABT8KWF2_9BACT|nr:DinB family protein [Fulvivirgaceae bacterium BMA10]
MKHFFKELFEYNHQMNQLLIEESLKLGKPLPERSISLFSHVLNAHDIWNTRVMSKPSHYGVWEVHNQNRWDNINETNYRDSLSIIDTFNFDAEIYYTNSKGLEFNNTVRDILFHVINHSNYHRAQIASDFRFNDITPLNTDYIFYKR